MCTSAHVSWLIYNGILEAHSEVTPVTHALSNWHTHTHTHRVAL